MAEAPNQLFMADMVGTENANKKKVVPVITM